MENNNKTASYKNAWIIEVILDGLQRIFSIVIGLLIGLHAIFLSLSVLAAFMLLIFFVVYQAFL